MRIDKLADFPARRNQKAWPLAIDLFGAWRKAGLAAELHVFQTGRHGFGTKGGGADHYLDRIEECLKLNGWLTKVSN